MKTLENLNEVYNTIEINGTKESLVFCFWSEKEIQDCEIIKSEWDIDKKLVPFWGDWHDLFCHNQETDEIIYLNDYRETICTWKNLEAFIKSLSYEEEKNVESSSGIIEEKSFLDF